MMNSNQIKIETFDKYIMRGGDQSLSNIEDLCEYGFMLLGAEPNDENLSLIHISEPTRPY